MILFIIFLTSACCFLSWWYIENRRKYKDIDKIPGPPTKLLTGNAHEFGTNIIDLFQNTQRLIKEYGPIVRIWQGPFRLNLFLTNPDYVEYFLSSSIHIKKSTGYDMLNPWLGQGLLTSTGERWKKHRKILTPAFHFKILEQLTDIFHNESTTLVEKLIEQDGKTVDIYPYGLLYAMDTLCQSAMNVQTNCQKKSDDKYMSAAKVFLDIFMRRFFSVLKRYDFFFQFTNDCKPFWGNINTMHSISYKIIQERKKELLRVNTETYEDNYGKQERKVFLDLLLQNNELTDKDIREEVDTFMFAGHDTMASAIGFLIYEIAKHTEVQEKVLQEIYDVVGTDRKKEIKLEHLKKLTYLECVVKEGMRIFPPVPFYERQITADVLLDGMTIPKGTTISFHTYSHHRNEKLFPDPEVFDPDRFLPENIKDRHPYAYIPFSAGPRNCIGQKYALMNAKAVVANVIRNFKLYSSETPHKPILGMDAVLLSMNGLPVKLVHRK